MESSHLIDFKSKELVLLGLLGALVILQKFGGPTDTVGRSGGHSESNVLPREEFIDSSGLALG